MPYELKNKYKVYYTLIIHFPHLSCQIYIVNNQQYTP